MNRRTSSQGITNFSPGENACPIFWLLIASRKLSRLARDNPNAMTILAGRSKSPKSVPTTTNSLSLRDKAVTAAVLGGAATAVVGFCALGLDAVTFVYGGFGANAGVDSVNARADIIRQEVAQCDKPPKGAGAPDKALRSVPLRIDGHEFYPDELDSRDWSRLGHESDAYIRSLDLSVAQYQCEQDVLAKEGSRAKKVESTSLAKQPFWNWADKMAPEVPEAKAFASVYRFAVAPNPDSDPAVKAAGEILSADAKRLTEK